MAITAADCKLAIVADIAIKLSQLGTSKAEAIWGLMQVQRWKQENKRKVEGGSFARAFYGVSTGISMSLNVIEKDGAISRIEYGRRCEDGIFIRNDLAAVPNCCG